MSTSLYHADYEAVRESLRAMRIKANLTQTAIAEQLGVGQSYVSKLERGENYVDVLIFARSSALTHSCDARVLPHSVGRTGL